MRFYNCINEQDFIRIDLLWSLTCKKIQIGAKEFIQMKSEYSFIYPVWTLADRPEGSRGESGYILDTPICCVIFIDFH